MLEIFLKKLTLQMLSFVKKGKRRNNLIGLYINRGYIGI